MTPIREEVTIAVTRAEGKPALRLTSTRGTAGKGPGVHVEVIPIEKAKARQIAAALWREAAL